MNRSCSTLLRMISSLFCQNRPSKRALVLKRLLGESVLPCLRVNLIVINCPQRGGVLVLELIPYLLHALHFTTNIPATTLYGLHIATKSPALNFCGVALSGFLPRAGLNRPSNISEIMFTTHYVAFSLKHCCKPKPDLLFPRGCCSYLYRACRARGLNLRSKTCSRCFLADALGLQVNEPLVSHGLYLHAPLRPCPP